MLTSTEVQIREQLARFARQMRVGEAVEVLPRIVQLAKEQPTALVLQLLGECYLKLARPLEAVVPLAAATGLADNAEPATLLATTLMQVGRSKEALLIAQRVLRRDSRNREALRIMQQTPRA